MWKIIFSQWNLLLGSSCRSKECEGELLVSAAIIITLVGIRRILTFSWHSVTKKVLKHGLTELPFGEYMFIWLVQHQCKRIDAMCCVWPDKGGYLYIYRCGGVSGGGGEGKHDGYRHVQILLCMDISSIMKMLNNFQGPLGFLRVGIVLIWCTILWWTNVYMVFLAVLEVKDMQDGKNVDKISLTVRASDQ